MHKKLPPTLILSNMFVLRWRSGWWIKFWALVKFAASRPRHRHREWNMIHTFSQFSSPASACEIKRRHRVKTFTICHQHPKAHKAFCLPKQRTFLLRIQFRWKQVRASEWQRDECERSISASILTKPLDTFLLFIQIAIKINHFCVISFFHCWWSSSFFPRVFPFALSTIPFYCSALRLWESFTFNVYFCWKGGKE